MQHGLIKFVITIGMLLFGQFMPALSILIHLRIPPLIMDGFQCLAYVGTGMVGLFAALNYFGIKWNPFKKKKK